MTKLQQLHSILSPKF